MRNNHSKILSSILTFMFSFHLVMYHPVEATSEGTHEVLIQINETIRTDNGQINDISRFNENDIALFSRAIDRDTDYDFYGSGVKYGLVSIAGDVLLEPIYDDIWGYSQDYYGIRKFVKNNSGSVDTYEGLVSTATGSIVIDPIYSSLPDLSVDGTCVLQKRDEAGGTQRNTSTLFAIKDGLIREAKVPESVDLNKYKQIGTRKLGKFTFISALNPDVVDEFGQTDIVIWLVDLEGDAASEFTFTSVEDYAVRNDGVLFAGYQMKKNANTSFGNFYGLIKVFLEDGKPKLVEMFKGQDPRISGYLKQVYLPKKESQYYDLISESFKNFAVQPESDLVTDCRWMPITTEIGPSQVFKCGLNRKDGTVIFERVYDTLNVLNNEYVMFGFRFGDKMHQGVMRPNGDIVIPAQDQEIWYDSNLDWIVIQYKKKIVLDEPNPTVYEEYALKVYDPKAGKIILKDIASLELLKLFQEGSIETQIYTGKAYRLGVGILSETLTGFVSADGKYILEPVYESLFALFDQRNYSDPNYGLYKPTKRILRTCEEHYYQDSTKTIIDNVYECETYQYGFYNFNTGVKFDPIYSDLLDLGSNIYLTTVTDFNRIDFTQYVPAQMKDLPFYTIVPRDPRYGLIDITKGVVLPTIYAGFSETNKKKPVYGTVKFDSHGLLKVYKSNFDGIHDEKFYNLVGLCNKYGMVIEPLYIDAYYESGYYFLKNKDGSWILKNATDESQTINIPTELLGGASIDDVHLKGDYILIESEKSTGLGDFSLFGAYTKDLVEYLPLEFTKVDFDGTYWYLQRYIENTGTYQNAIMNLDKEYVVEFSNRYESLSAYVGNYAVGTSGNGDTSADVSANSFKRAAQKSSKFVLDILNTQGIVVGDFKKQYQSITLTGVEDGKTQAIVKKDGKFYRATLVEGPNLVGLKSSGNSTILYTVVMVGLLIIGSWPISWLIRKKTSKQSRKKEIT